MAQGATRHHAAWIEQYPIRARVCCQQSAPTGISNIFHRARPIYSPHGRFAAAAILCVLLFVWLAVGCGIDLYQRLSPSCSALDARFDAQWCVVCAYARARVCVCVCVCVCVSVCLCVFMHVYCAYVFVLQASKVVSRTVVISNEEVALKFKDGILQRVNRTGQGSTEVSMQMVQYNSTTGSSGSLASNNYKFLPAAYAAPVVGDAASSVQTWVTQGQVVQEVRTRAAAWAVQRLRIHKGLASSEATAMIDIAHAVGKYSFDCVHAMHVCIPSRHVPAHTHHATPRLVLL